MLKTFFSLLILLVAAIVGGTKAYIDDQLQHELAHYLSKRFPQNHIHYQQASLSILGAVTLQNITMQTAQIPNLQIKSVTLQQAYRFYDPKNLPDTINIKINRLTFPINEQAAEPPFFINALGYQNYYVTTRDLRQLGYLQLQTNINLQLQQHDGQFQLVANIDGDSFGKLKLNFSGERFTTLQNWSNLALSHADIQYMNTAFIERILLFLAQRQKIPVTTLKQHLATKIKQDLQQSGLTLPATLIPTLQNFIQKPNNLNVTVSPQPPIILEQFNQLSPQSLINRLKLQVTATKQDI